MSVVFRGPKSYDNHQQILKTAETKKMADSELPKATIVRIAKDETDLRISEDAKKQLIEATEEFIRNVSAEASSHDFFDGKKTIQARDVTYILNDKRYKRMIPKVETSDDD